MTTPRLVLLPEDGSLVVVPAVGTKEMRLALDDALLDTDDSEVALKLAIAARPPVEGVEVTEEMIARPIATVVTKAYEDDVIWNEDWPRVQQSKYPPEWAIQAKQVFALLAGKTKGEGW